MSVVTVDLCLKLGRVIYQRKLVQATLMKLDLFINDATLKDSLALAQRYSLKYGAIFHVALCSSMSCHMAV